MPGERAGVPRLTVLGTGRAISLRPRLVIAGFTGRDEDAVAAHVSELAAIGVPIPRQIPAFYHLDPELLTTGGVAVVRGRGTSGEVEPVIVRHEGRLYLTVGSDHTDRELERTGIAAAKAACGKPISSDALPLPDQPDDMDWDDIEISCTVDGVPYQRGLLAALRHPADLLPRLAADATQARDTACTSDDLVLFCGTLPLLGGEFIAGTRWDLELRTPSGTVLRHAYKTHYAHIEESGDAIRQAVPGRDQG